MATEIELKLLIDSVDIAKLRRHPLLKTQAPGGAHTQHLTSIYFDTPELALKRSSVALRVRRVGTRWVQTVKAAGEVHGGLHRRGEWEDAVARGHPDLTKIQEPALVRVFSSPEVRDTLQAVFSTEFRRTAWLLQWDNGDEVELALDQGEVKSLQRALPLSEIELELKQGNPARLYQVAQELHRTIPLRLENVSKAARGYQLFCSAPPPLVKAVTPRIDAAMSVADAFQSIVWNCIGHWTANQEGVLNGDDPEYLHQMRVALRRLRSALPLFASAIPRASTSAIAGELKWLAGELGPARNWDVFVTQTLPPMLAEFPADQGLAQLRQAALSAQSAGLNAARRALLLPRYHRLLLHLGYWLMAEGWQTETGETLKLRQQGPVIDLARRMLGKRHKTVRRHGPGLAEMPPEERHEVRIAVKKLRYATEFFAALYPSKASAPFLKSMAALQDELGSLNDVATTHQLLSELSPQNAGALGIAAGWSARGVSDHLARLDKAWKDFCRCRTFWD